MLTNERRDLVLRYEGYVRNLVNIKYNGDEDIYGDAMVKLCAIADDYDFEEDGNPDKYFRVKIRKYLNDLHRRGKVVETVVGYIDSVSTVNTVNMERKVDLENILKSRLTEREYNILNLMNDGYGYTDIGRIFNISGQRVKHIYIEALAKARRAVLVKCSSYRLY